MTKIILIVLFATVFVAAISAAPMEEYQLPEETEEFSDLESVDAAAEHLRFRRVTCDLLSFGGFVADSACAANCLSMGKAGGKCKSGVCQCRKTKIKDLWDKRFG
ncbi:defensin-1-like [Venturia canescens]|uniref:defensin-1-like n=1 Tax=Venturia canescens TaxID=32260 RepID=UPI001C9D638E|nr:defensin-1-like [Venturia canescens]